MVVHIERWGEIFLPGLHFLDSEGLREFEDVGNLEVSRDFIIRVIGLRVQLYISTFSYRSIVLFLDVLIVLGSFENSDIFYNFLDLLV